MLGGNLSGGGLSQAVEGEPHVIPPSEEYATAVTSLWMSLLRDGEVLEVLPGAARATIEEHVNRRLEAIVNGRSYALGVASAGALVGYVDVTPGGGSLIRHRSELQRLMVSPSKRRQGHGRRILGKIYELSQNGEMTLLHARVPDIATSARALLFDEQWNLVGRRRMVTHLGNQNFCDELMFQKNL